VVRRAGAHGTGAPGGRTVVPVSVSWPASRVAVMPAVAKPRAGGHGPPGPRPPRTRRRAAPGAGASGGARRPPAHLPGWASSTRRRPACGLRATMRPARLCPAACPAVSAVGAADLSGLLAGRLASSLGGGRGGFCRRAAGYSECPAAVGRLARRAAVRTGDGPAGLTRLVSAVRGRASVRSVVRTGWCMANQV
jgi:hypothetical protein